MFKDLEIINGYYHTMIIMGFSPNEICSITNTILV